MGEKKRVIINIVISVISQIVLLVIGVGLPRIFLVYYGSDTNGFISTITQIFVYMGLLGAGISQSARNALYKPVKDKDKESISHYISLSHRYYKKISLYYFVLVIAFCFVLPFILKTSIDYWTIFFYVFFEGMAGVISFRFIEIWNCLLNVDGKYYVSNTINLISRILMCGLKMFLAIKGFNIALIQCGYFLTSLISVLLYSIYMKKNYGWINYNTVQTNEKLKDRNSFIITELCWTIFSSTDMIVLSIFVSTSMSSVYSVYNMVFVAINSLVNTVYASLNYKLGQTYNQDIKQYIRIHDIFNSIFFGGVCAVMATTYIMIPSFISLYTRGVNDIQYSYKWLPLLFCLIQIFSWSRTIAGNLISIAGRISDAVWALSSNSERDT